jgi:predicted homoserine dehydrogenase-like protein
LSSQFRNWKFGNRAIAAQIIMVILDKALAQREAQGRPIRIGLVGAGFMGRGIALQLSTPLPGMRLVAIANRHLEGAARAWTEAGREDFVVTNSQADLNRVVAAGSPVITTDPALLCHADGIDAIMEVTGNVEASANTVLEAIAGRKHVVLMNAELDATIGPILKVHADKADVVLTNCDGDEPGITMNLLRMVKSIGYRPVMAGNIKGFLNYYRTEDTQREFAERTHQRAKMCAAYADGTKLCFESCLVANATGFQVGKRGMFGHKCAHVKDIVQHFSPDALLEQPLVDFALEAAPGSGVFVVGYNDEPAKQHYMNYLKMGNGPLYVFYAPYVLPHLEAPLSAARAVLFGDAAIAPLSAPACDVVATAKRDLKAGETLDGMGGYTCYGLIENAHTAAEQNLLPMGLSDGCRLVREIRRDEAISYDDVVLPADRLADRLRREQDHYFAAAANSAVLRSKQQSNELQTANKPSPLSASEAS